MSSDFETSLGVLPADEPVPYLVDDPLSARERFAAKLPEEVRTWWHVTWEPVPALAAQQGLIPSCWTGGDCCVVFGHDTYDPGEAYPDAAVLEIRSRVCDGQLKALWVPWWCIVGAWRAGKFVSADELRKEEISVISPVEGCPCSLAAVMREQQAVWRATCA